jgi:hypothetical protein
MTSCCFHLASHLINTKLKALPDPHMGLREGIRVMGEGWEGSKEEIER